MSCKGLTLNALHHLGRSDVKETIFWTNYFFNCDKVRTDYLERLQSSSFVSTLSSDELESEAKDLPPTSNESTDGAAIEGNVSRASSQNSLVPADDSSSNAQDTSQDDAASFVQVNSRAGIASPPCSLMSVEDLVLVNKSLSGTK